jgi:hypothetical protein
MNESWLIAFGGQRSLLPRHRLVDQKAIEYRRIARCEVVTAFRCGAKLLRRVPRLMSDLVPGANGVT